MAQRVHVIFEDDVDGSDAVETVAFSVDGVHYEIDLSEANASQLREDFSKWIIVGRRVGGRRSTKAPNNREETGVIRAWAVQQGLDVSSRGRIPQEIRDAYDRAR